MSRASEMITSLEEILTPTKGDKITKFRKVKVVAVKDKGHADTFGLDVGKTFTVDDTGTTNLKGPGNVAVGLEQVKAVVDIESVKPDPVAKK